MPRKGTVLSPEAAARQAEAIKKWQKENTTNLCIRVRKDKLEKYKAMAKRLGKPLGTIVKEHLDSLCDE